MAAENIDIKMPLAIAEIPVRFIMFYIPELETAWFLALAALAVTENAGSNVSQIMNAVGLGYVNRKRSTSVCDE